MTADLSLRGRLTACLLSHLTRVMPHARSEWADAMRSEFEHVKHRPGALAWLLGCVFASYRHRLTDFWPRSAHRVIRHIAVSGVVMMVVGYALENGACGQTPPTTFIDTTCDLPKVDLKILPRLRCGLVSVPRNYTHPEAGQYKLAVVVIRSERQPAAPEPVAYMSGGPGGPLTVFTYYQAAHPLAAGRDVVLVDQRGTGRSEPHLCPSRDDRFVGALVDTKLDPAAAEQRRALFAACRSEATAQGVDLTDFGTQVTAEDFDRVRQALRIERWNLFGVSYGTTVAMTYMALHPETVRSAVLDSIYPPDPILPPWSTNVTDAVRAFLAFCQTDAPCNALYPDLMTTYRDTVYRLSKAPLSFPLPAGLHGSDGRGPLTAELFKLVVGRMVYYPQYYSRLPRLIAQVYEGNTSELAAALSSLLEDAQNRDTGTNFATNAAVDCRDRPRFHEPLGPQTNDLDRPSLNDICNDWVRLGPPPLVPIGTTVPTLMLAGEFDPNARPVFSQGVATLIGKHVQWIEFAGVGHSVRSTDPCAAEVVAAFIDQPTEPVDASCATRRLPVRFLAP